MSKTEITTPEGTPEIISARTFPAPAELVFRAYTEPELIKRWLGPSQYEIVVDEWELRHGGRWRFAHVGADGFTLPEGTKLQVGGENDPAVVTDLQEALTAAGYNPGAADGTYGEQTEAAVVAFQEANGLAVDGRVGPETAVALNAALAEG